MRVLIVDDNHDCADSQACLVRTWGHDAQVAYDGTAALALAQEYRPDVMFIDLGMPKMDGYALAGQLRSDQRCRHVSLIAISGHASERYRQRALAEGFDDFFVKPADPMLLLERLSRCPPRRATPIRLRHKH